MAKVLSCIPAPSQMIDLGLATVDNYQRALKSAERAYSRADADDKKVIGGREGIISELEYVIEWLETGRRPGNKRWIECRAVYQREKLVDLLLSFIKFSHKALCKKEGVF
ncbi:MULTISPECIES: hypothetical protein [Paenibacillus]|uniref:hypothetical protein n=1 Tax=Paenibacillus TaxID=44249 RepID=UPI002685271C